MKLKESLIVIFVIGIAIAWYLKNPTHRFELEQKFATTDCQVTDYETTLVGSDNVVCENYDSYYADAKYKNYMKYSSRYSKCLNKALWVNPEDVCGSLNDVELNAMKQAKSDADANCYTDYLKINSDNKMLLTGETNCNENKEFNFIVIGNESQDSSRLITKGYITVVNGKFKKIVNLGEKYNFRKYKVLFK